MLQTISGHFSSFCYLTRFSFFLTVIKYISDINQMNLNSKSYIFQYFLTQTTTGTVSFSPTNRDLIIYGKVLKVIEEFTIPCYAFSIIMEKKGSLKGKF